MIDGYNNNSYTSNKRLQEDRQKYLEDYWGGTLDDFTKKKLSLYNLMFRLCYSTEEKYVNFFKELSLNLTNIGINEKYNDKKIQILKEIQEIYERSTLTEDPFLNFIHEFEKTYNSLYKLVPQHNALSLLKTIYRILEDVIAQKEKIFASGFKDPIKNEIFHEFQDEIPYNNPITIENLESVSIVEDFYQPKELKKKKEKLKKNTGKDDLIDIDVNCVEDLKNYFKEFMETYEGMIKTSREFWQMNLVEILEDLYGDKRDHEILEGLTLKLYNDDFKKEKANALAQEAAEFLLKHRNEIRVFCKIKGVFEKNSPDKKDKIKKDKAEFNKPTNFQVKGVNKKEDYMIDIGNEDAMLVDNYEILSKILVFYM